jgi:Conidiation protein 6
MSENTFESAGAKSAMSQDMKELGHGEEDISHQVQGHKANLSNPSMIWNAVNHLTKGSLTPLPDTSGKSKAHSRQVIESLGGDQAHYGGEENPQTKNAAENLEGTRFAAK